MTCLLVGKIIVLIDIICKYSKLEKKVFFNGR